MRHKPWFAPGRLKLLVACWVMPGVLSDSAVDGFADEVGVAGVASVFLDHVNEDAPQTRCAPAVEVVTLGSVESSVGDGFGDPHARPWSSCAMAGGVCCAGHPPRTPAGCCVLTESWRRTDRRRRRAARWSRSDSGGRRPSRRRMDPRRRSTHRRQLRQDRPLRLAGARSTCAARRAHVHAPGQHRRPAWYAAQLASIPAPFTLISSDAVRAELHALADRLNAAATPASVACATTPSRASGRAR